MFSFIHRINIYGWVGACQVWRSSFSLTMEIYAFKMHLFSHGLIDHNRKINFLQSFDTINVSTAQHKFIFLFILILKLVAKGAQGKHFSNYK